MSMDHDWSEMGSNLVGCLVPMWDRVASVSWFSWADSAMVLPKKNVTGVAVWTYDCYAFAGTQWQ